MSKTLTDYAEEELNIIHQYSLEHNGLLKKNHAEALLDLITEHIDEVKDLYAKGDDHYLVETGDIVIMCLGLIKDAGRSPDDVFERCYARYHKKLPMLIKKLKDEG